MTILFDARPTTQAPFLRNSLKIYKEKIKCGQNFASMSIKLFMDIIESFRTTGYEAINNWIKACENIGVHDSLLKDINNFKSTYEYGQQYLKDNNVDLLTDGRLNDYGKEYFKVNPIEVQLKELFDKGSPIIKLKCFLEFEKVRVSAWKPTNIEHINPLFKRIESVFHFLEKVIDIREDVHEQYKFFNIISLVNANIEITRLIPMLFSKMIYNNHKLENNTSSNKSTIHLIIDEAHNILNSTYKNTGDDWQNYRLSIFEEIIKEGRKFGFSSHWLVKGLRIFLKQLLYNYIIFLYID